MPSGFPTTPPGFPQANVPPEPHSPSIRRFKYAREFMLPYFSPSYAARISEMPIDDKPMCCILEERMIKPLEAIMGRGLYVHSMEGLYEQLLVPFSRVWIWDKQVQVFKYHQQVGRPLSDSIVAGKSVMHWFRQMIMALAGASMRRACMETDIVQEHMACEEVEGHEMVQTLDDISEHTGEPKEEYSDSDDSDCSDSRGTYLCSDSTINDEGERKCPINDIHLQGTNIISAWMAHKDLRLFEMDSLWPVFDNPKWVPGADGTDGNAKTAALAVYHGTPFPRPNGLCRVHSLCEDEDQHNFINYKYRGSIYPSSDPIVPHLTTLPVIWTAYSPLRSYLWALFDADVIGHVPNDDINGLMSGAAYRCRRQPNLRDPGCHVHRGVRLLRYNPRVKADANNMLEDLNGNRAKSAIVPAGTENDYREASQLAFPCRPVSKRWASKPEPTPDGAWDRVAEQCGEPTGMGCPNILHVKEMEPESSAVHEFTGQMWRTAWDETGLEILNASRHSIFSISFEMTTIKAPALVSVGEPNLAALRKPGARCTPGRVN
ncbi:hypothetical protein SEUCBS140593_004989 [Sporothrix eucalyptigena]|uniref:Uncharacterized protein n=1 Tax=Sporothrix eucalyptigena TaxID=1812306 RepID=A0ABP0BSV8_9PEZI